TMPEATLNALADHGAVDETLSRDGGDTEDVLARFAAAGVDVDLLAARLQDEGARSFVKAWNELMAVNIGKRDALAKASRHVVAQAGRDAVGIVGGRFRI